MSSCEQRKYRRLPIKLDLSCRKAGSTGEKFHTGCTVNVSPGGLYFESEADVFKQGNLLKVEMSIPPTAGLLELGGSVSGLGKVLRIHTICDSRTDTDLPSARSGVALEFCQPLKLCV
ncbi:MAG TPA: PilZ domain-containing protein [Sedimentisphaerales bacterium]|nr:PilZ domain-containing protein [Sedimentisphaerales bacterium]